MQTLRAILRWYFGLVALFCGVLGLSMAVIMPGAVRHDRIGFQSVLLMSLLPLGFAALFGVAWWSIRKGLRSSRVWGILASVTLLLACLFQVSYDALRHDLSNPVTQLIFGSALVAGLTGIILFSCRPRAQAEAAIPKTHTPIPGDGTSRLLEKIFPALLVVTTVAFYYFWPLWCKRRSIPGFHDSFLWELGFLLLTIYEVGLLHEAGHALAALCVGMKVRDFVVGPLHWGYEDGRPRFRFSLDTLRSGRAWVAAAQATRDLPLSRLVIFSIGGAAVNLVTGIAALTLAGLLDPSSPLQAEGLLVVYGFVSCLMGVGALVPRRYPARKGTRGMYSDGAQLYQLLSGGPWGDYHRAILQSSSSLVTAVRPRDFDTAIIQRAAMGITQGAEGLILRLLLFDYHLDRAEICDAAKSLREASSIYDQSGPDLPAEMHALFVFGEAYLLHDAVTARQWWGRMETKKPVRFNVDYWRAKSALCWIEGDLGDANVAWEKCEIEAQKLPLTGAYEFDRYLSGLLREAIDASMAESVSVVSA